MKVPLTITKNRKDYIFVKAYTNFILYKNIVTGVRETFTRNELKQLRRGKCES